MSDSLSSIKALLSEVEERAGKATPGKWFAWQSMSDGWTVQIRTGWLFQASDKGTSDDARFIASARTDIPRLTGMLRVAVEALEEIDAEFDANMASRGNYTLEALSNTILRCNVVVGRALSHISGLVEKK